MNTHFTQGYNTGYPYKGMEMLLPMETNANKKQSLEGRKSRQTRAGKNKNSQSTNNTSLEEKRLPRSSDEKPPVGPKEVTKESFTRRQEPVAATVSPPSSAVDDTWDFLRDSPQEVAVGTTDQQVWY